MHDRYRILKVGDTVISSVNSLSEAILQNVKDDRVFHKDEDKIWICRNCGHVYIGKDAKDVCPVCQHPRSYMEVRSTNYN